MKSILLRFLVPVARLLGALKGARQLWAHAVARAHCAQVAQSAVFMGAPEVHGTGQIRIGGHTMFYPAAYLETREDGTLTIGDDVVCSRGVHLVAYNLVVVGKGTMIGEYSSIRDANHLSPKNGQSLRDAGHVAKPVVIGQQVWLGRGVTVLAGVTIGDGAVVAAGAVVTQDVPAGALVGGIPARILRQALHEDKSVFLAKESVA